MSYKLLSNKLLKSGFFRNVLIVASGTAGAQLIAMLLSPVITRLYGPEIFGLVGVVMGLVAILTPISCLSLPVAIVVSRSVTEVKFLSALSMFVSIGISLLVLLIIILFENELLVLSGLKQAPALLWMLPIVPIIYGCQQITFQLCLKKKTFYHTATAAVMGSAVSNTLKVIVGYFHVGALTLFYLTLLMPIIQIVRQWQGCKFLLFKHVRINFKNFLVLFRVGQKHSDYIFYRTPQALINATSQSIPVLMLASLFDAKAAGFYVLAKTVTGVPSILLGKSVGDVFYPKMAEVARTGARTLTLLVKATLGLIVVGFVPFGIIFLFGPELFSIVFGAEWEQAGDYARWLAIWFFVAFLNKPANVSIPIFSLLKFNLVYEISSLIIKSAALYVGYKIYSSDTVAIVLFCMAGVFVNLFLIGFVLMVSYMSDKKRGLLSV